MHEAEKVLDADEVLAAAYYNRLSMLHFRNGFMAIRATAAQRAEAFLRCTGRWQESAP